MKKIILTLAAIIMVSMSSVSMASNRGKHKKHDRTEIRVVRSDNYYGDYDNGRHYVRHDYRTRYEGPEYKRYKEHRYRGNGWREDRYYDRGYYHNDRTADRVTGAIIGATAVLLLTGGH